MQNVFSIKVCMETKDGELPGQASRGVKPRDAHWLNTRRHIICLAAPPEPVSIATYFEGQDIEI
jgi:hypothetical protein